MRTKPFTRMLVLLAMASATAAAEELPAAVAEVPENAVNADTSPEGLYPTLPVEPAAEPAAETPKRAASASRIVEEIIVTAQKREEKLQDVPIAVAAFSADQLSALGVESTKELGQITPGLQFSEIAGFTLVYLRGVGTDSFLPYADPSVATYVDGLYIPAQQGIVNSFGGVERVEVLKGPQGTLFGRNSTGGAINVITKSPGQVAEASAQAEVSNFNTRKAQVYASFPIFDSLAVSVSGIYNDSDPYYKQVTDDLGPAELPPEDKLKGDQSKGGRVKLRWTPTDTLDIGLSAYRILQEGAGSTIGALKDPSLLATTLGIQAEDADYQIHRNEKTTFKVNNTTLAANAKLTLPLFDLKLIVGHQDIVTDDAYYDFDNSAKDLVSFFTHYAFNKVTTAEFQIASNADSWMAEQFTWIGGLYYLHSSGGYDPIVLEIANGAIPLASRLPVIGQITAGLPAGIGVQAAIHGVLETNAYSAFAQGTWDFTDWFALTLGGRYQYEDRFLTSQNVQYVNPVTSEELLLIPYDQPKVDQKNFSPKVSFNFKPADDVLVYLSYARGYKSGTYNGINVYTPPNYVKPETVDAYELGLKSEFFGGGLRFNTAIFQNKVKDQQVTFVSLANGGAITFENAGSARIRGAEADILAVPFLESNPGFVVTLGASYLNSIFTDYQDASGFDEQTGLFFGKGAITGPMGRDFTGNRIPRSPKFTSNLGLNQTIDLERGTIEIGVDGYYNSGFFYGAQNSDVARQKKYSVINTRVSYLYKPWNTRLTLFGQNLDDETYSFSQFTADFGTNYTLATPRTYGLRVNWDF